MICGDVQITKIMPQYVISKVMELVANEPKVFSNQDQMTLFVINIEIGLNIR